MSIEKTRHTEALADICFLAGARRYHSGDSRADIDTFIRWANEFEKLRTVVGHGGEERYNGMDYMEAIEEFIVKKIDESGHARDESAVAALQWFYEFCVEHPDWAREQFGDDAERDWLDEVASLLNRPPLDLDTPLFEGLK